MLRNLPPERISGIGTHTVYGVNNGGNVLIRIRWETLRRLAVVLSMLTAGIAVGAEPSWAGMAGTSGATANCGGSPPTPGDPIATDNYEHTVFRDGGLTALMNNASTDRLNNQFNPLDIDVIYLGSVSSTTDLVLYDQDYSTYCGLTWGTGTGQIAGLSSCVSRNNVGECEKNEVRYDEGQTNAYNDFQRRSLACHEIGHSIGLVHVDEGCMTLPANTDGLSWGDADSINWWFDPSTACCDKNISGNQSLTSPNGDWRLIMQSDGNLVGYQRSQSNNNNFNAFWSSGTSGRPGAQAVMQGDGNLVIYHNGAPVWSTGTDGNGGATLSMQSDRHIVIYRTDGSAAWWSGTNI